MSMKTLETAAEYAVSAIVRTSISNEDKRSAIAIIYEKEEAGDTSFTKFRNMEDLSSCGYAAAVPYKDIPEDKRHLVEYRYTGVPGYDDVVYVERDTTLWNAIDAEKYCNEKDDSDAGWKFISDYEAVLNIIAEHDGVLDDDYIAQCILETLLVNEIIPSEECCQKFFGCSFKELFLKFNTMHDWLDFKGMYEEFDDDEDDEDDDFDDPEDDDDSRK